MRKVIKEYDVYKFDELDKDIQEKLIEKESKTQAEMWCEWNLEDYMNETAKEIIDDTFKDNKIKINGVYYDLGYCQGSGACICFNTYLEDVNNRLKIFTKKEMEIFKDYGSTIEIKHYGNYNHEYSFQIEDYNIYYDIDYALECERITEKEHLKLQKKLDELEEKLKEIIVEMNVKLKQDGYYMIEDEDFFKEIALDFLNENEYLKDGTIFNE